MFASNSAHVILQMTCKNHRISKGPAYNTSLDTILPWLWLLLLRCLNNFFNTEFGKIHSESMSNLTIPEQEYSF